MDDPTAISRMLDSRMFAEAHVELQKAVRCASDLFEANIKCLAQITRLQKDAKDEKARHQEEREVLNQRIESLVSVVERQQCQIDAMHKVGALGDVWSGVAVSFGDCADAPSDPCRETINRCCAVMAWISLNCLKGISYASDDSPQFHDVSESDFQVEVFAREVALQLAAADTAVRQAEAESASLRGQLRAARAELARALLEAEAARMWGEQSSMRAEDQLSTLSRLSAELKIEREKSKHHEKRISVLERSVADATQDGDCWRAQCSAMSRTVDELAASLRRSSPHPPAGRPGDSACTATYSTPPTRYPSSSSPTDVVALALSLNADYVAWSGNLNKQSEMRESELCSGSKCENSKSTPYKTDNRHVAFKATRRLNTEAPRAHSGSGSGSGGAVDWGRVAAIERAAAPFSTPAKRPVPADGHAFPHDLSPIMYRR